MIEIFPPSSEFDLNISELENLVKNKLKTVEQKLTSLDNNVGLKDLKEDFVLENKLFDTLLGIKHQLNSVFDF